MNRLIFLVALLLTFLLFFLIYLFNSVKEYSFYKNNFAIIVILCFVAVAVINYSILHYFKKKQISKETVSLLERPSKLSTSNNNTELNMLKQMEDYRKEYVGNIAHELKTPLFSIQSYIETLIDGGVEDLTIRDKYLHRVNNSIERLLNIVLDLDMINRLEIGEITLHYTRFDISSLIQEVFELLDLEAQKKKAHLIFKKHTPVWVLADKQKISQVLINLVSNAIHYANRDQAKIEVSIIAKKDKVFITVKDNGMGIKPEALPRVFERFYRIESSRNRRQGGSGLGLAIVKHILEAHSHTIKVESVYLSGTEFTFTLDPA